jgi:hypothetical protein
MGMKNKHLMIFILLLTLTLLLSGCTSDNSNPDDLDEKQDSSGFIIFDYPPVDLDKVEFILPMGYMGDSHVTPTDHQYYVAPDFLDPQAETIEIDVYSPADGVVTNIQHMAIAAADDPIEVDDYLLDIKHTSTITSHFIHIDELSEKIAAVAPPLGEYANVNVPVEAGEIIGKYRGSVDYNVVDEDVTNCFIIPESYEREDFKIHIKDPFEYFNESIKSQMIEKCLRKVEPFGGEICYDIDGKLVGTWFQENTNGYGGIDENRYWAGHLSIAYNYIDPDHIVISIGTFVDSSEQFGVVNNSPDPRDIGIEDGLVKYELVSFEYLTDDGYWDRGSYSDSISCNNSNYLHGVVLFELIEERKLKMEVFPGLTADEVNGFTDNYRIYVR